METAEMAKTRLCIAQGRYAVATINWRRAEQVRAQLWKALSLPYCCTTMVPAAHALVIE